MTAIQANLADIGIKVKIQQMDRASWIDRYYGKGTAPGESIMSMIGGDGGPPSNGYGFGTLHSTSAYPKGGNGWNGYHYSNSRTSTRRSRPSRSSSTTPSERTTSRQVCKIDVGPAALHQPVGNDPLLDRQQPDRELREHPRSGHGQLLQGRGDVVHPQLGRYDHVRRMTKIRGGASAAPPLRSSRPADLRRPAHDRCAVTTYIIRRS